MVEVSDGLPAEMPRRLQADLGDLKLDVRDIRTRFGHLESLMTGVSTRMDRRDETVEHILKRLDPREAQSAPSA